MAARTSLALLHGGGQGGWIWDETIAALRLQAGDACPPTIAFDLAGCGTKRGQDTSGLSVREVASAFVDELASAGLADIVLVSHSNAGTIMPIVAELRPGLVRRFVYLTCIAPPPDATTHEVMSAEDAVNTAGVTLERGSVSGGRLEQMFCNDMDPGYAKAFLAKLGQDRWPTLDALDERGWRYDSLAETDGTYIVCLRDRSLRPEWQEIFAERLHAGRRVYLDAGHQAMNTRPHALAEILLGEARGIG